MKEVLIILDGLMEEQLDFNPTSWCDFSVLNRDLDSLNCTFNLLGYSSNQFEIGERAYYEALANGISLQENEVVLRCNIVRVEDGKLVDFTGGRLPSNIESILQEIHVPDGTLYAGDTYKNLLLLKNFSSDIKLYPPHFHVGEDLDTLIPKDWRLQKLMKDSKAVFNQHGLNGCMLWPWGLSTVVHLPSFYDRYQKVGAVVSGIDLVAGMGLALGMKSIKPSLATGYENTDLVQKLEVALSLIQEVDVLIVHINGLDELAHQKDFAGKLAFLEKINTQFILPLVNQLSDTMIYITCDHRTDSKTGKHEVGKVPMWEIVLEK